MNGTPQGAESQQQRVQLGPVRGRADDDSDVAVRGRRRGRPGLSSLVVLLPPRPGRRQGRGLSCRFWRRRLQLILLLFPLVVLDVLLAEGVLKGLAMWGIYGALVK